MKSRRFIVLLNLWLFFISVDAWAGTPGTLKWAFEAGGEIWSSPAVGTDGTIYIGSKENKTFYAINPDGTRKWAFIAPSPVVGSPGISSDGTIYIQSEGLFTANGYLHAFNPDGTEKWRFRTGFSYSSASCPSFGEDGTIYVGSDRYLWAINTDGTEKWRIENQGAPLDDTITSGPSIGPDGTIYIGSCRPHLNYVDGVHAVNPDGTEKWNFEIGSEVRSSPAISSDGTIYVGSKDGDLYAINPDGTLKWTFDCGIHNTYSATYLHASPSIGSDGTIYIGGSHHLGDRFFAINPDGTEKWAFDIEPHGTVSSAAIGDDGTIYFAGWADCLFALNPDGTQKWVFEPPSGLGTKSSPTIGTDGTIYVGINCTLYALYSNSNGLASSPWPMFNHDARHAGRHETSSKVLTSSPFLWPLLLEE